MLKRESIRTFRLILEERKAPIVVAFCVNLAAYYIFITNYLLNNHGMRFPYVNPMEQFFAGRWFATVFFWLAGNGNSPLFSSLLFIIFNILAAFMTIQLWERDKLNGRSYSLLLIFITTFPTFTGALYYHWCSQIYSGSIFLGVAGLLITKRSSLACLISGSILVTFSLATYQPALSVITTIFIGYCFISVINNFHGSTLQFQTLARDVLPKAVVIIFGLILYRASLYLIGHQTSHATQSISLDQLSSRLLDVFFVSFKHLTITQPEFGSNLKIALICILALGWLASIFAVITKEGTHRKKKLLTIFLTGCLLVLIVVATKTMFIISSSEVYFEYRYNLSWAYLFGFAALLLINSERTPKSAVVLASALLILTCIRFVQVDLSRQGVLIRGQQHDLALANRILYRIESLEEIDYSKEYVYVRVGDYDNYRWKQLNSGPEKYDKISSSHMGLSFISASFAAGSVMQLLGSSVKLKFAKFNPNFKDDEKFARSLITKFNRKPWPHKSSVFVHDDKIIVYMR